MGTIRPQRSTGLDRFLGVLSRPNPDSPAAIGGSGVEFHEDEVLWSGSDSPERMHSLRPSAPNMPTEQQRNSSPNSSPFRRISEKSSGILAALPEDDKKRRTPIAVPFIQRKPSISPSSASTSPSSTSSARMIPVIPKPKQDYGAGKVFHQSAPVNIPIAPRMVRHKEEMNAIGVGDDDEAEGDDEMLPPHEIIARRSGVDSPMTTFSVLEGIGRTLKGRDLRRVRNAVWRKTGFLD